MSIHATNNLRRKKKSYLQFKIFIYALFFIYILRKAIFLLQQRWMVVSRRQRLGELHLLQGKSQARETMEAC